ncbi:MAG: peptidylprolyl isomerase [Alphaproteobacteria bacterium]|nr:peptidylprolyl isomerase [Alphaproteobacteria bacterium]
MTTWRQRVQALFLAAALLQGGLIAFGAKAQESERIAAVVNDDIISMRDLEERLKMAIISSRLENSPDVRRRLLPQVLRKLLEERLQMQEATRQGISLSDQEINGTVRNIEAQNNLPPGGLEVATRRDGVDYDAFLAQIRAELSWMKLLRRQYSGAVKVTENEVDAQLNLIKSNMSRPQYRLAEIVLNIDNPAQEEDIRALAERIVQQARQGAPFPALARQFSQTATAAAGGDMGWIYEGQLPVDVENVVKALQPAQISNPLRTLTGFHILLLIERRSGGQQAKDDSVLDLAQLFLPVAAQARPEEIRIQTDLVRTAAETAENCDDMVRLSKELGAQQNPRPGKVTLSAMPQNLRQAMETLPAGKVTAPQKVNGGVAVFMVCSRKDDNGMPERAEIEKKLEFERLDVQARRLLRDLKRQAIIDIRI